MKTTTWQKNEIKNFANKTQQTDSVNEPKSKGKSHIIRDSRIESKSYYIGRNQQIPPMTPELFGNTEVAQSSCNK